MRRTAATIAAALALAVSGGCAGPSVWQQGFVPEAPGPARDQAAPVVVRSVPWERMSATLDDLQRRVAASDVPPDEWPPDERERAEADLLRGLQVSAEPSRVSVVGRSAFRTTDPLVPEGADRATLERFARTVGATHAVYSSRSRGQADKIVDRPVTSWGTVSVWGDRDRSGRWRDESYTHSSTTWVPVTIKAEQAEFVAFFLRIDE
jgi:hypothetical protein